ncbi:hypothetical protein [Williamsia soli]|uniref:hypothetical protein n=1 Tax=Williamsia soli TaxID=364929 RepID=UPI001A9E507B|nr:hypothetical protein [Williamsia soli]
MIDHDYVRSVERCLDCGGEVLVEVAYDDRGASFFTGPTVQGYDCQERDCGSQFDTFEWDTRTRNSAAPSRGSLVATLRGR